MKKRLLVDMSSVCWTSLLAGKDKENGVVIEHEGRDFFVNPASYGYENAMNHLTSVLKQLQVVPRDVILVMDGKDAKAMRKSKLACYKETRDKRPPEAYEQFNALREMISQVFLDVGGAVVTQQNAEADDTIAYLCQSLDGEKIILSSDGDLSVLVNETTHILRNGELDQNPYGPFAHRHITVYKALVGDTSDNIPGAKGFGEKAFLNMLVGFGDEGLDAMSDLIRTNSLHRLEEDVAEFKPLQKVIDYAEDVYKSWFAALLHPEWVNTMRRPLEWRVGMVKPRTHQTDDRLKQWAGQVRLIHAGNYEQGTAWMSSKLAESDVVALDIETATPFESDLWMVGREGVDVFGSRLVGMGLTFGDNGQYTFYFTVNHKVEDDVQNLDTTQVAKVVEMIPRGTPILIQNVNFELPVLYREWGGLWKDNGWNGFIPNALDTKIMASYVNENLSGGLKQSSKHYLGYEQETYDHVTTLDGVRYKMSELTARHVLNYGADDTICTMALYNHYSRIMEIEKSWDTFIAVEQAPSYLVAKAFVDGTPISLERMKQIEASDDEAYAKSWSLMREFLIRHGFDGTVCPRFDQLDAATVKEICLLITGQELDTRVRKLERLADEIQAQLSNSEDADLLAGLVRENRISDLNEWVARRFDGEPVLDLGSTRQLQKLMYDVLNLPVRIVNKPTAKELQDQPDLSHAVQKIMRRFAGHEVNISDEEMTLARKKAKTDDTAVDFALLYDAKGEPADILKALKVMKTINTRRNLFYKNYRNIQHWEDGRVHASINQCATVTRRFSSSAPNLQQLPKKGEGVKFREIFVPHHKDAVIVSIDFSGQELRLAAERSQDKNMLACYIGDKLKDIHSITAAGAMRLKWGAKLVKELFEKYPHFTGDDAEYDLFMHLRSLGKADSMGKQADDLRKNAKNVNFAAQFGAMAPKIAETLIMTLRDAELFLEARNNMFPDVTRAAKRAEDLAQKMGYAQTMMGVRRHLTVAMTQGDESEKQRAARQAWNMEIQGSAAEMTKLAMGRLWNSGILEKLDMRFIAPIHDELVWSVHRDDAVESIKVVHECMVAPYSSMKVPVMGSISIGPNFGHQIECGDWYIEENIKKALSDIFSKET